MIELRHPTSRAGRGTILALAFLLPAGITAAQTGGEPPPDEPASAESKTAESDGDAAGEPRAEAGEGEEAGGTEEAGDTEEAADESPTAEPDRFSWAQVGPPHERRWVGEPISLSLKDADLVEVLRSFAKMTGANLIIDPDVKGSVTVELKDVPWDQALDAILKSNGLGMEVSGNVRSVQPAERVGGGD